MAKCRVCDEELPGRGGPTTHLCFKHFNRYTNWVLERLKTGAKLPKDQFEDFVREERDGSRDD